MKIIDVPVFNDDGSIKATMQVGEKEAQFLLEFALNMLAGMGASIVMKNSAEENPLENINLQ